MGFRDRQWYLDAIKREEGAVERHQSSLEGCIRNADYYQAAEYCDKLKAALLSLNACENKLADLDDAEEERNDAGN